MLYNTKISNPWKINEVGGKEAIFLIVYKISIIILIKNMKIFCAEFNL